MNAEVQCPNAQAQPQVRGGVVAYLLVDGASKASEFYQRAFAASEIARQPVDEKGRTMHVHLYVNGSSLMLCDPYPEYGHALEKPQAFDLMLQVDDIDAWFARAVAAGAEVVTPVQEMFWGARYGQLRDPFGVRWSMNQPLS
ncbi:MAG TPA: glyoxalase/bleomycin resistance/extradiol dioxygenase family protein [Steroidobacteraceae bacterium]|jgi:PhnB protein|nr:glyoxalase/bleomycin resistance/extradiol dioxygenase family protein [Steroidobacteraceae bacterium]